MSSQLLLLLKFSLLALLYLFLLRVVRAVWAELSPPAPEDLARPVPPTASPSPSGASAVGVDPAARGRGVPKSSPPTGAVGSVGTVPASPPAASSPVSTPPPGARPGAPVGVAEEWGAPGATGSPGGRLVVVSPPELAGRSAEVVPAGILVGRGGGCDLVVEDSYVSQRHLRVSPSGPQAWLVEDLGSTNGTFIDGERLTAPRVIGLGELVSLGGVVVTLR